MHTTLTRQQPCGGDSEEGAITLFFVVVMVGLLAAVGLVVDGGGKIRSLQRADAVAAEAARVGGQAVQPGPAIRGQIPSLQVAQARSAAAAYLSSARVPGTVRITSGRQLEVDTTTTYKPIFLNLIGIGTMTTTGHAQVRLVSGLNGER